MEDDRDCRCDGTGRSRTCCEVGSRKRDEKCFRCKSKRDRDCNLCDEDDDNCMTNVDPDDDDDDEGCNYEYCDEDDRNAGQPRLEIHC